MLMQMDGLIDGDEQENPKVVMVLAATNHPWDIGPEYMLLIFLSILSNILSPEKMTHKKAEQDCKTSILKQ